MVRSDFLMEVRGFFVNRRERRLRAGWRLLIGVFVVSFAWILGGAGREVLAAIAPPTVAGAALVLVGWWFYYGLPAGTAIGLSWLVGARRLRGIGVGGPGFRRNLGFGLALGLAMTTTVFLVGLGAGLLTVADVLVTRSGMGFPALPVLVAVPVTALLFVAVGVGEELLFRGYLMTNLAEGFDGLGPVGPRGAIAVAAALSSALFGLVHAGNPGANPLATVNITVVGLFLAVTYVLTGDIGIATGVHVAWNFSLSAVYGFPVSGLSMPVALIDVRQTGDPLVTGGEFGPEAGLVLYAALAVAVALTWWWVRRETGGVAFRTDVAVPDLRGSRGARDSRRS